MTRRGKVVLAVLTVGSLLGLVVATNAWFVSVNTTPPGKISSALVRYLPDTAQRSFSSLLTYGSVISGSGVDPDGVPLVLPGDRLLSSASVDDKQNQNVRTSIARDFEDKETVGTVIHWEVRTYGGVELTRKQRDLMDEKDPVDLWFVKDGAVPIDPPSINPTEYDIVTTTGGGVGVPGTGEGGVPITTTTTIVTTTYTARASDGISYRHEVTTTNIVTHEGASISPADSAGLWADPAPAQYIKATETVLFVQTPPTAENPATQPTRSYLLIEHIGGGGAQTPAGTTQAIPLSLGNLSTVETNLRIGLVAYLTPNTEGGVPVPLVLKGPEAKTGNYYLGSMDGEFFVELIVFHPYTPTDGAYRWAKVDETTEGVGKPLWSLWDLEVKDGAGAYTPAVPALPVAPAEPVGYTVSELLGIVSKPSTLGGVTDEGAFEIIFNKLYCENVPTITLRLSYYARQSEFMEWNEFYSQNLTMDMSQYQ